MKWLAWLKKAYFIAKTVWPIMLRLNELKKEFGLKGLQLVVHQSDISVTPDEASSTGNALFFDVSAQLKIEVLFNGHKLDDAIKTKVRDNLALALKDGLKASRFDDSIKRFKV